LFRVYNKIKSSHTERIGKEKKNTRIKEIIMKMGRVIQLISFAALLCVMVVTFQQCKPKEPPPLKSIPMQIVSGIPIWVAGDNATPSPDTTKGRDQLVDALDAAFARVLDSGKFREIINSDPVAGPLVINIGDCYPRITDDGVEIYPFPQNPTGVLATILARKSIRMGTFDVVNTPGTFHVFDYFNPTLMRAIIDELGKGYGLPPSPDPGALQIVPVLIWPPSSSLVFTGLNNGDYDITDFLGALGATASVNGVEARRRKLARFTCTAFGTPWYIHVRNDSTYNTFDDVVADTTADICVGQLSARLSDDYFKNAKSITQVFEEDDLIKCSEGVIDGTYDAYLHFDPVPYSDNDSSTPRK
jgi:ABC-type amino acid transport substrate-binding protein